MEVFEAGDGFIDFSTFPDGSAIYGVKDGFTPGTYLVDQFASVGVRFRSTISPYPHENPMPDGIGVGIIGGPTNNYVNGMRYAPPNGLDGRTVWEVRFDEPVIRAGILRYRGINYSNGSAITNFYSASGSLIVSQTTHVDSTFVSHQVGDGEPGIKRIEVTSTDPSNGTVNAGCGDEVMFSQVGSLPIPEVLRYRP
jgi:hypothetical protein